MVTACNREVVLDDEYGSSIVSPKGVYIQSHACIDIFRLNDRVEISGATSVNIAREDSSIGMKVNFGQTDRIILNLDDWDGGVDKLMNLLDS